MMDDEQLPTAIYSVAQVRALEQMLMQTQNVSDYELMQRVAEQMWQKILRRWPTVHHVLVCCGPGNNAGDGYVIATLAKQQHKNVRILAAVAVETLKGAARLAAEAAVQAQVNIELWSGTLPKAEFYIDALFGIGLQRDIDSIYKPWIACINQVSAPVVAIDVPSGIDADTGAVWGVAVKATLTITALALKIGLCTGEALDYIGDLQYVSGGLSENCTPNLAPLAKRVTRADFLQWPTRLRNAHKGLQGHVLIIGGDVGMGGAVILAAEAALRAGAGLVTVATRAAHISALLSRLPEVMAVALELSSVEETAEQLTPLLLRASVVVIGPGLGQSDWSKNLLTTTMRSDLPLVMDADALNLLAFNREVLKDAALMQGEKRAWVLTPHPKEAARLLKVEVQTIQRNRVGAVQQLSEQFQAIVLLKGAGTLIASPTSGLGSVRLQLIDCGNPGMAVAGMGDALSGIIAALIAQGLTITSAASIGAWLHATAGDQVVVKQGIRGMRTSDLIAQLPFVMQVKNSYDL